MTKKELTLGAVVTRENKSYGLLSWVESTKMVKNLAQLYSGLLEERVSVRRTLKLVHAQLAMMSLLLLGGLSMMMAILLCVWTVLAVWQCKVG